SSHGSWSGGRQDSGRERFGNRIFDNESPRPSAASRRPGMPVMAAPAFADEDVSQDTPLIAVGSRVKHRKIGSGTIAELAGAGRDLKAKIDFDDETIGRKTLVVAQANLERGD